MSLYMITVLMFLAISLFLFLVLYIAVPQKTALESRLDGITYRPRGASTLQRPPTGWQKFLGGLGGKIPLRPKEYGKYTRDLLAAGIKKQKLPVLLGAKVLLALAFPAAYLIFYGLGSQDKPQAIMITAIVLFIIGYLAPSFWLARKIKARKLNIFHDLPDVLDLMTVCVEAGLSLEAAILRIAEDPQFRKSPLYRELQQMTFETRAGKPRADAMRDMGDRVGLDDLKSFVAMLLQTEQLGTSLANSLRVHSDSLRTIRRQLAEEKAAKTSIKLLFPLVFLFMPAIFVVLLLPALLRLVKVFAEM